MTRKNMGGVLTDHSCRVVDSQNRPIPRLYAAGELSGFAGINGTSALEGTFLGPCVVTGRMAARTAVADARKQAGPQPVQTQLPSGNQSLKSETGATPAANAATSCIECHDVKSLVGMKRPGYAHFEKSHQRVLDRSLDCMTCHFDLNPYQPESHRIDWHALSHHCGTCHLSKD